MAQVATSDFLKILWQYKLGAQYNFKVADINNAIWHYIPLVSSRSP